MIVELLPGPQCMYCRSTSVTSQYTRVPGGWYVSRLRGRKRERERGGKRGREREWREGERERRRKGQRRRRRRGSKKVEHFEHLVLFGSESVCVGGGSGYGCDRSVCISTCMYACVRISVCLCGCPLYTNIPHDALKNNIRNLVREAFKIRGPNTSLCTGMVKHIGH